MNRCPPRNCAHGNALIKSMAARSTLTRVVGGRFAVSQHRTPPLSAIPETGYKSEHAHAYTQPRRPRRPRRPGPAPARARSRPADRPTPPGGPGVPDPRSSRSRAARRRYSLPCSRARLVRRRARRGGPRRSRPRRARAARSGSGRLGGGRSPHILGGDGARQLGFLRVAAALLAAPTRLPVRPGSRSSSWTASLRRRARHRCAAPDQVQPQLGLLRAPPPRSCARRS